MATHSSDDVGSSDGRNKPDESHPASTSSSPSSSQSEIPSPPLLDGLTTRKRRQILSKHCNVPYEMLNFWDMIFEKCSATNRHSVKLITIDDKQVVAAHKCVLSIASPVFEELLKEGVTDININLVPHGALRTFIRLLYSSRYEKEDMKKFILHVLHLSHFYDVPFLERFCIEYLQKYWLNPTNVLKVLQVAKEYDLPRLSFICFRQIFNQFEVIKSSQGWKDMSEDNHALQEELLQEIKFRKQEMVRKSKAKKGYSKLHAANEALVHIYMHGCNILQFEPREKLQKGKKVICGFPECEKIKRLFKHFCFCVNRTSVDCNPCICLWKLLKLHSRMCDAPHSCGVPLCSRFREKENEHWRKDEIKWKLLAIKVKKAKSN